MRVRETRKERTMKNTNERLEANKGKIFKAWNLVEGKEEDESLWRGILNPKGEVSRHRRRAAFKEINQTGPKTKEFGVCWVEFNKREEAVKKERFFATDKARDKFVERLQEKDNFWEIDAWCDPK